MTAVDRAALAQFLRSRRDRLRPQDVGLPSTPRRRAPGLRREEVAQLAGMSVDYYVRLEQRRGPQPSEQMCLALARTLQLTPDERDHLFRLAGHPPPERAGVSLTVRPAVLRVLERLDDCAVFVASDTEVVLAQNRLARLLLGDRTRYRGREASGIWRWFTDPRERELHPVEEHDRGSRVRVADLRAAWARRRGAPDIEDLVNGLLEVSEEFAELWERHEVGIRHPDRKRFLHPAVGHVDLDCEVLATAGDGQVLVILSAEPGSENDDKLRLISMVGEDVAD